MKYIIVEEMGIEVPIIFSDLSSHAVVAGGRKVIAAGFCRFLITTDSELHVTCWGKSVGLGVGSRWDEDENIILKQNDFES